MGPLSKRDKIISWTCRIIGAAVLAQTLFFKFAAAPESVYIFAKVGIEPWGRYVTGIAELIAAILLLTPRFAWAGSLLAFAVMSGAIISHLTVLGVVVMNDGGLLFGLALLVMACSLVTLYLHRRQFPHQCSRQMSQNS